MATGALIVMQVRRGATPINDVADMAHNGICFDVWLGAYDEDGDFIFMWSDSRRLEPFPESELVYTK